MSRKNKIIVSIVGIVIVTLALLGITYAYYLTRIQGNTNTNSISITTANLQLLYGDGNEIISASNIMPGTTLSEKTFTVTNTGKSIVKNYRVVLEYALMEDEDENTIVPSIFERPEDFQITLTCVSKNVKTGEVSGTCNGYTGTWNNESFDMIKNTIDADIRHEYSLTIYYANPNTDQSNDMGKNLNLKVQIYGETDTTEITSTITGADTTYAMKLNSNPKVSVIKNVGTEATPVYQYKFTGIEPGTHTLTLVDKDGNDVSSETLTINKGTSISINGTTITVKDNNSKVYLTTNNNGTDLSYTGTFNPYSSDTTLLSYNIINNAMQGTTGTKYSDNPLTTPGKEVPLYKTMLDKQAIPVELSMNMTTENGTVADYYWTYGTGYELDPETGKYSLTGVSTCKFSECYSSLVGKYLVSSLGYYNSNTTNVAKSTTDLLNVYVVSSTTNNSLTYKVMTGDTTNTTENLLSTAEDDYGTSYYFRGRPNDNYLNYDGKCWRILRIQGNGTIKLVLDNYAAECNANNYSVYSNSGENNAFLPVEKIYYNDMTTSSNEFKDSNADKLLKAWMDGGSVTYHGYDGSGSTVQKTVNLTANLDKSKLTTTKWCFNKSYDNVRYLNNNFEDVSKENATHYEYSFGLNLENAPSLKCDFVGLDNSKSSIHESYIGLLTADEAVYAGNVLNSNINSNYLNLDNVYSYQVQYINDSDYWLMTPVMHNTLLDVRILYRMGNKIIGNYMNENYHQNNYLRPAIVLRSDVKLSSGNGTQSNPYILAN